MFKNNNHVTSELVEINLENIKPVSEFTQEFYYIDNNDINDIFVFPDLENKNIKESIVIKDMDELFEKLKSNHIIYIEGEKNSGKTVLCKALYRKCHKLKLLPLYIDMSGTIKKKYEKMVYDVFTDQYGYEKSDYEKFKQKSKSEKVVIIDNFDKICKDDLDSFCNNLETEFGNIIYVYSSSDQSDLVTKTKQNIECRNNIYHILPFYLRKRKDLILKLLNNTQTKIKGIDDKVEEINKFITDQIRVFSLDPAFISRYVNYYIKNNDNIDAPNNIFGKVFESNITYSLQKVTSNENIEEYYSVLELLAYKVHFARTCPFSVNDINIVIKNYNEEYMMNVNCSDFRKNVIIAGIIEDLGNDQYRFLNDSYLAYFAASVLNKKVNDGTGIEDLEWICNNVCFNINGEILLFLSYITSNKKILEFICNKSKEIMQYWDEFNIENNKISFLSGNISDDIKLPSLKDQENHEENLEKQEKKLIKNLIVKTKSIYDDYDETKVGSVDYLISQSLRYIELISKILPNFNHNLKKEEKITLVENLYSYPNKISNKIFINIDKNLQYTIDELLAYCKIKDIKLTKNEISAELEKSAMFYLLNLYDVVARLSVNSKTISVLDCQELQTINHKLQNIMMHENLGKFNDFAEKADKLYDKTKNLTVKTMIKLIMRKHFICNKNLKQVGYVQKIASKYFGSNRKFIK